MPSSTHTAAAPVDLSQFHRTPFLNTRTFVRTDVYYVAVPPYAIVQTVRSDGRATTAKQLAKLQRHVHAGWGYRPPKTPQPKTPGGA